MPSKLFKFEIKKFKQNYFEYIQDLCFEGNGQIGLYSKNLEQVLDCFEDNERYELMKYFKDELTNFLKNHKTIAKEYEDRNKKFQIEKGKFVVITYFTWYEEGKKKPQKAERRLHLYFSRIKKKIKYLDDEISFYEKYETFEKGYDLNRALQSKFVWLKTKQDLFFMFDTLEKFGFIFPDNVNDILKKFFIIYDSKNKTIETLESNTIRDLKSKVKGGFTLLKPSEPMQELRKHLEAIGNKP